MCSEKLQNIRLIIVLKNTFIIFLIIVAENTFILFKIKKYKTLFFMSTEEIINMLQFIDKITVNLLPDLCLKQMFF